MRKSRLLLSCLAALALLTAGIAPGKAHAEEGGSFLKIPVGLSYASTYWWRGVELKARAPGVLWPSVGLVLGDTGILASGCRGLDADYISAEPAAIARRITSVHEVDYGASFAKDLGDIASFSLGILYAQYPFYDDFDSTAVNPAFLEGSLGLGLKTILNPRVDFYYDYYVKESAAETPQDEDFYVKFSLGQEFAKTEDSAVTLSAWIGYYNNAYADLGGFSDAGLRLGFLKDFSGTAFAAGLYYARFARQRLPEGIRPGTATCEGKIKNHVWADFSVIKDAVNRWLILCKRKGRCHVAAPFLFTYPQREKNRTCDRRAYRTRTRAVRGKLGNTPTITASEPLPLVSAAFFAASLP